MYRKNHLHGCCCVCFALGIMIGHSLESWLLSFCGGLALLGFGVCVLRGR